MPILARFTNFCDFHEFLAFFQESFQGGKIYCYANFFVMLIFLLFSDQISGAGAKVSEGSKLPQGAPPVEESQISESRINCTLKENCNAKTS